MVESVKKEVAPRMKLNSGHEIPVVGLGTFLMNENPKEMVVKAVLEHGYRHIDTAMIYQNEEQIGEAIQEILAAGVPRSELFITTKLWHTDKNDVEKALRTSLAKLKLDYVDMYLVHWMRPYVDWETEDWKILSPPHHVVWGEMERMVDLGLTKTIGVSNCTIPVLADLIAGCKIRPAMNQVEVHPYFNQAAVKKFHEKWTVKLECYASIGSGHWNLRQDKYVEVNVLKDETIKGIADAIGKSPAQVILRWHVQRGTVPLVKTTKIERLTENISLFDFELTDEQMTKIDGLDNDVRLYNPRYIDGFDWGGMPYYN